MKKLILLLIVIPLLFISHGCEDNPTEPSIEQDTTVTAYKPNIYIYPKETLELSVEILFPNGGEVIESIPSYNNSWDVTVSPNGKINNTYDYLFYECNMPNLVQKKYGWIIGKLHMKDFFITNMKISDFSKNEIDDFIEYWIPLLQDFEYYEIYPQYKLTLDEMVEIKYSVEPTNFYRLFYFVEGRDDNKIELETPEIQIAKREDYYAVEWGVIR